MNGNPGGESCQRHESERDVGKLAVGRGLPRLAQLNERDDERQSPPLGGMATCRRAENAEQLHLPSLLASVRTAFVQGMNMALLVSAGIALVGGILALLYLPKKNAPTNTA
jgi:hypothetical protein